MSYRSQVSGAKLYICDNPNYTAISAWVSVRQSLTACIESS
jgi:hypothetical protein